MSETCYKGEDTGSSSLTFLTNYFCVDKTKDNFVLLQEPGAHGIIIELSTLENMHITVYCFGYMKYFHKRDRTTHWLCSFQMAAIQAYTGMPLN